MRNILAIILLISSVLGAVQLPAIFSDHAVLQRSKETAFFGKGEPGEMVNVSYGGVQAKGRVDANGRFLVKLDLSAAGDSAGDLVVIGKEKKVIRDVIVGEVWLCAGQSNMAMKLSGALNAAEAIRDSANDRIRMFLPDVKTADAPQDEIKGQWLVASPETAGRFTAVGYYFARKLNRECGLSVGLLNPACGGSLIQAWTCGRHLESAAPAVAESARKELNNYRNYRTLRDAHVRELLEWEKNLQWVDDAKTSAPPADAEWRKAPSLAGRFPGAGVVWFRKSIELTPADVKDGGVFLWIGRPLVETRIFWDGRPVMTLTRERAIENWPFRFKVATSPGKHVMMMRVSATEREFGFPRENLVGSKPNAGGWEYARERDFPAATPEKLAARPRFLDHRPYHNEVPGLLWNSMLHPILPYTIKGTLWYQGESNSGPKGHLYGSQLAALVTCLREDFQQPEMRFYAVQLPEHHPKNANPNVMGYWTEIRAGQSKTIGTLPFASEIVTLGVGESGDIHPLDKQPVGERLAALAMRNDYGKKNVVCDYPTALRALRENGNRVRIEFSGCNGGLVAGKIPETYWVARRQNRSEKLKRNAPAGDLEGFALCGKDGKWFWAAGEIEGDSVVLRSDKVAAPVRVCYAWQNNPTCNLFNGAGLPARPFMLNITRQANEPFSFRSEKIYPQNQLPNPIWKKAADGTVPGWFFEDHSKRGGFKFRVENGEALIETAGGNYGYFTCAKVPVKEGVTYFAGAELCSSSKALIWMETRQYSDKMSPYYPPYSNTRIFLQQAEPSTDPVLRQELKWFVEPENIIDSETWISGGKEFTVPSGHGVNTYIFMLGCYGGRAGFFRYSNPVVMESRHQAKITLGGKGLSVLSVYNESSRRISTHKLNPEEMEQQLTVILPSRMNTYHAEIIDATGKKYRRAL